MSTSIYIFTRNYQRDEQIEHTIKQSPRTESSPGEQIQHCTKVLVKSWFLVPEDATSTYLEPSSSVSEMHLV